MNNKIKKFIIKLSNYINLQNYRYYILNKPRIKNYKYDKLFKLLIKLEKKYNYYYKYTPTKKLNNNLLINKNIKIIKHNYKMYSINNVYNKKELVLWLENIKNQFKIKGKYNYICELKYDGLAISLIYKYGILSNAITRGDGKYGNNIFNNILYLKRIPFFFKKIKNIKFFDIKGEIVYSKKAFAILNKQKSKQGLKEFSNPRNAANGIIHNIKDNKNNIFYKKKLDFIPYLIYTTNKKFNNYINNQFKVIEFLNKNYFNYQRKSYKLCKDNKDIINFIKYWEKNIYKSKYPIDGIVIKINNFYIQNKIKYNNIFHKWCIAYKFKDKEYKTKIRKIVFTIGKSGIIVPIVKFTPINISGSKVKQATLYNSNIFNKYNLCINDKIKIKKCGNIIPKIIENITFKNRKKVNYNYRYLNFPLYCPSCKNLLSLKKNKIYCLNKNNCIEQTLVKIKHFISKNCMNINIRINLLKTLLKTKIINYVYDIYKLNLNQLILLNCSYKESNKILLSIKESKNKKFSNILFSLSIPNIGLYLSKLINKKYNSIDKFFKDIMNNKINIINLGEKKINKIKKYFINKKNIIIINKLKKIGLNL
ncbi:MAG: NAD-dependent DNA ligase LigA [Candidatus Shikimatogenerans bostrichidophilus]|nr:MAG: NAD-dependent DNA ligase LigA [Candidatus Shikimatogenerans bostrichidophilus]